MKAITVRIRNSKIGAQKDIVENEQKFKYVNYKGTNIKIVDCGKMK